MSPAVLGAGSKGCSSPPASTETSTQLAQRGLAPPYGALRQCALSTPRTSRGLLSPIAGARPSLTRACGRLRLRCLAERGRRRHRSPLLLSKTAMAMSSVTRPLLSHRRHHRHHPTWRACVPVSSQLKRSTTSSSLPSYPKLLFGSALMGKLFSGRKRLMDSILATKSSSNHSRKVRVPTIIWWSIALLLQWTPTASWREWSPT